MYKVLKYGKLLKSLGTFDTYEEARSAVRRYIRKMVRKGALSKSAFGVWDDISRNPAAISHVFKIKRV